MAESVLQLDPGFDQLVKDLAAQAKTNGEVLTQGRAGNWLGPAAAVSVDIGDPDAVAEAFDREAINSRVAQALGDTESPGVSGDMIAAQLMIDYTACAERAYINRHCRSRPRAMAHAAARMAGHGAAQGVLLGSVLGYVSDVLAAAKGPATGGSGS